MGKHWEDKATKVRAGEELDTRSLEVFLKDQISELSGNLEIEQFPKGFSNLTYLLRFGDRELVLRRAPFGANIKSGHDMGREYKILTGLSKSYHKAPAPYVYSENVDIIGAPFYVMERVKGIILRSIMPKEMVPDADLMGRISQSFVNTLVELHALDYKAAGLGDLGKPKGYVSRQIKGWTKRYSKVKTEELESLENAIVWLHENMPEESTAALIHNDFKYDNLVLETRDWTTVKAVLDWEMSTLGDPLMDLGTSIAYWINTSDPDWLKQLALSPTTLDGNPLRSEIAAQYSEKSGLDISNLVFYYVYGIFKIAVIAQQIYYRFHKRLTNDQRFASLNKVVEGLGVAAIQAIQKDRIDNLF